ncbi:MAG TPA: NAD(P)H-dependent glycerol-3-phosphate dehydrogenase [Gemmatimonadales bacterium]|nr:NAD(P)H-dependent glycerol-3-phosphate dehydrogenase [Gemmatimonadales bacterium]
MTRIAVLGAGSWGTTLADLLARKGHDVTIWAYEAEVVERINQAHENHLFLPGASLATSLRASGDAAGAVRGVPVVLSAAPSHAVRAVMRSVQGAVEDGALVVSATKGIENETLALMSDIVREHLPRARFAALSGPSFAQEVFEGQPTAVVAAAESPEAAHETQEIFATRRFRVYSNRDVVGVELGGALKNVIAVAAGMLEGLGLGHNPRAALITRGLAEITRLGLAMKADPMTFAGLAGMGDLILTTTGSLSRNRALGLALARGETLDEHSARHRTVAEGAYTSRAAAALAVRLGVEMPVTENVCQILFEGKTVMESMEELMERDLKSEQWR